MRPLASIIVPTYCEAENLVELVPRITSVLEQARISHEIIVVDDDSGDGTVEVCESLSNASNLRLEVRTEERGLATAVLHGMNTAQGEVLVVMDADLSHPPGVLPSLVQAIDDGADMAIGSRYVEGGTTEEDWGLFRWLNSKVATWMARPLTQALDPMAGFIAIHRAKYNQAKDLDPVGYKIGLELLVKCGCRLVKEVPIHFSDRTRGESKLCLREQLNYLKHLKRLYDFKFGGFSKLLQFIAVGATGMVVDLAGFFALSLIVPISLARAIAIWLAMSWNWILNRNTTFADETGRSAHEEYLMFCASCGLGGVLNWFVSLALCTNVSFFRQYPLLAGLIGIGIGTLANATLCMKYVFRPAMSETLSETEFDLAPPNSTEIPAPHLVFSDESPVTDVVLGASK